MNTMIFRPSLKRRLVGTLLIGTLFIWGILLAKDFLAYRHKIQDELARAGLNQSLLISLEQLEPSQFEAAIAHTHATFAQLSARGTPPPKGPVYFQWRHLPTGRTWVSHPSVALPAVAPPNGQTTLVANQAYWPVSQASAHWQLTLWHPAMDDAAALAAIALDLLSYIVWAFPVLVLLMMLAVWQGFKPLKRLTDDVQARSANDFAALTDPTGYVELAPILKAFNDLLGRVRYQREHEKQFYETVAHELKTPLAIVAGHAHVVATSSDQAVRQQSLRVLEKTIETLSTQINQLICLSSLSSQAVSRHAEIDLVRVAQDLLIDFMPLAQSRQIELTLDAPDQLSAHASESALELVMKNLLKNAITHGKEGGRVEVRIGQSAGNWSLSVSDDGPGLPTQEAAVPRHAGQSGSGLGLTIVAHAVEVLQGSLTLGEGLDGAGLSALVVAPAQWPARITAP